MARAKIRVFNLDDLVLNEKYYPRVKVNWLTVLNYAESLKAGAKFPPITVTKWEDQYIVVDGFHRIEAYRKNNISLIQAEVIKVNSEKDIFKEAIKRNITHGRPLSPYEKRLIIVRGINEFKLKKAELQDLLYIKADKFELFVGKKAVNVFSGKPLEEHTEILKSPTAEAISENISPDILEKIKEEENPVYGMNQRSLLNNVLFLLKNDLINLEDKKIVDLLLEIRQEINKLLKNI